MRLAELKKVSYPETVAEAVRILAEGENRSLPLSGGVSFVFAPLKSVEELVSLSRLPLSYVKEEKGGLRIGATTPVADLAASRAAGKYGDGILSLTARRIGSNLNRNLITVGGNLVQPFIWSDLPTVALVLNAAVVIQGPSGRKTMKAEKFFARMPKQLLKDGELVTEVIFPPLPKNSRTAYEQFALTEVDFAYLKTAIRLSRTGKKCLNLAIVIGGATILPQRASGAEAALKGKTANQVLVNEASEIAAEEIKIQRDIRCSSDYKRDLARAQVRGILERILLDQKVPEWKLF
ncbi:MAG: FAD binding domain-containing protein [Candidatus Erginobacter occultus]|nr:FAD binding domain-containing protein [Candidatus Erginobacter occultus]